MNPKSLEPLSKKEIRLLGRLAVAAGVSLKEYVGKVNCTYPGTALTRTHIKIYTYSHAQTRNFCSNIHHVTLPIYDVLTSDLSFSFNTLHQYQNGSGYRALLKEDASR